MLRIIAQPGFELGKARTCNARQRRLVRVLILPAYYSREAFRWRLQPHSTCDDATDIIKRARGQGARPRRLAPWKAGVEREPDRVADHDAAVGNQRRLARMQPDARPCPRVVALGDQR